MTDLSNRINTVRAVGTLDVQHLPQFDMILSDTADRFEHLKRFRRPTPR